MAEEAEEASEAVALLGDLLAKANEAHARVLTSHKAEVWSLRAEVEKLHAELRRYREADGNGIDAKAMMNEVIACQSRRSSRRSSEQSSGSNGILVAAQLSDTQSQFPKTKSKVNFEGEEEGQVKRRVIDIDDGLLSDDSDDSRTMCGMDSSKAPIGDINLNRNLRLRKQWTTHPEQDHTDLLILAAQSAKENTPPPSKSGTESKGTASMSLSTRRLSVTQAHDNLMNMKSKLYKVKIRSCQDCIAQPGANWRLCWDISGAFLIGYDTVMIPFTLSFEPQENAFWVTMNWVTMLFWTVDMFLTFFVGFVQNGVTIMKPWKIAKRYLCTWFVLDVVVVAGDWFNNAGEAASSGSGSNIGGFGKLVRSLRAVRVLRLLRLLKLRRMMAELQDHISSEYTYLLLSLTKLLFFILFLNHGIACLWFYMGRSAYRADDPLSSWVAKNAMMSRELGYKYTTSMHWTLTQFTPASMEVFPQNTQERTMSVIVLMFALVAFSSFVGSISTSMTALRNMNADINKQFWMLRRFLKQQHIPRQVSRRILKYLEYIVERKQGKVQQASIGILNMLSEQLREELTYELTIKNVRPQPFFQYSESTQLMDVVIRRICAVALKTKVIASGDYVFYPGDEATAVYCFLGGDLAYLQEDDAPLDPPLQELEWVAEVAFWSNWKHLGSLYAKAESELIAITVSKFVEETCKSVVSWKVASTFGEFFLTLLKGREPGDIMRDQEIKEALQELTEETHHGRWSRFTNAVNLPKSGSKPNGTP